MKVFSRLSSEVANDLSQGAVGIIRTDTIYGIVARASDRAAVERVFQLKGRDDTKSPIVLVSSLDQLFDTPSPAIRAMLGNYWPGKVSIIIPSTNAPDWIMRGNHHSVAYRLPDSEELRALIDKTGPLIAPSANPQGLTPAISIQEAQQYFGEAVDFYVDQGVVKDNTPSQLLRITDKSEIERLR